MYERSCKNGTTFFTYSAIKNMATTIRMIALYNKSLTHISKNPTIYISIYSRYFQYLFSKKYDKFFPLRNTSIDILYNLV